jgi:glycosyltransferase involved in cell wall biosynthesis
MTGIPCHLVFDSKDLKIINVVGNSFCRSQLHAAEWGANVVWLLTPWWSLLKDRKTVSMIAGLAAALPERQRVCVLTNEPAETELLAAIPNVTAAYVNHNAFVSPRIFDVSPTEKAYDAVVNARPLKFKRVHLCAKVERLCCVRLLGGEDYRGDPDFFDAEALRPSFINHKTLRPREVAELLNRSWCGVILSECEGACYASTEYLYCGLPVVSTRSVGGRHVWYDEHNSVIVEPSEEAVVEAVAALKRKLLEGSLSPQRIRGDALKLRDLFIERAKDVLGLYFAEFGLGGSVSPDAVVRRWLAEIDLWGPQFKYFKNEREAYRYLNAGNLWFWREVVRNARAGQGTHAET